jgi:DNA helicase-2/ATP-dependent DNA helicase PcrA
MLLTDRSPTETREFAIQKILQQLRSGQRAMAEWQGGELAVSAVPGAGKSTGMAAAAAVAIARYQLHARKQLLVVTFTRSAALNLKTKIRATLQQMNLPPLGFAVHTLHGLALQIATRHGNLSGLNLENSTLISANQNHRLMRMTVDQWIAENPRLYQVLLTGRQFDGDEAERLRRQSVLRTEVLPDLASTVIREAKSSGLLPDQLRSLSQTLPIRIANSGVDYPVLEMAAGLYDRYQTFLKSRGFIDYDDMILAALKVLENPQARLFWQQQVFAVFEDEAQDSTPLQSQLLEILATDPDRPIAPPHLIRVGDPNQAINSTFTPADPTFFKTFCERCERQGRLITMNQAGRSTAIVMAAANKLLEFGAFRLQLIHPVPPHDPQPNANPAPEGKGLEIHRSEDIHETVNLIRQRVLEIAQVDPNLQAAILVRENRQGQFLAKRLKPLETLADIRVYEVGQQDRYSHVPAEIFRLLQFIQRPHSPDCLKGALRVLSDRKLIPSQDLNFLAASPEQFLYPGPLSLPQGDEVRQARRFCTQLLQARIELPLTDLIGFLCLSLRYDQTELATGDKLAEQALQRSQEELSLNGLVEAIGNIINSEKFEPVDPQNLDSRYTQPRQLTIITMHKAKGLDWDYVFVPFLQEQTIPGSSWVPPQSRFLGEFTLSEVTRAQIRYYLHRRDQEASLTLPEIERAWEQAKQLKQEEEYRLLYVAMTRAKRLLWMAAEQRAPLSWNKPNNLVDRPPCPVIPVLQQSFASLIAGSI